MAPTKINPDSVRAFKDAASFYKWLGKHHDKQAEIWIKIHKVEFRVEIDHAEGGDRRCALLGVDRWPPQGLRRQELSAALHAAHRKSIWSQINVDNVARLISEGRMTEHGLREVDAAKSDGRWARAYNSGKDMKIPDDLQAAIDAEPKARAMLAKLSAQNRFALAFRTQNMKTEAGRKKKIEAFVAMLKRGETIYPQGRK